MSTKKRPMKMTKAERAKSVKDQAKLQKQLLPLNKSQRSLVTGLLHTDNAFHPSNVSDMIEYAGESEVTNVLLEAAYWEMTPKVRAAVKLLFLENVLENPKLLEPYVHEIEHIRNLGWLVEGTCVFTPLVGLFLQNKVRQEARISRIPLTPSS